MIIPDATMFDQRTLSLLMEHDPLVQRYQSFFALFDWSMVPDPALDPSRPGKRPHPQSAYVKALLLKREEGISSCTQLRRKYCKEHADSTARILPTLVIAFQNFLSIVLLHCVICLLSMRALGAGEARKKERFAQQPG